MTRMNKMLGLAIGLLLITASFALSTPVPVLLPFVPFVMPKTNVFALNDLLFTQGKDNLAGLVGEVYVCPSEDINTLPALAAATSLKTAAVAITCKTGKKFNRVYFTDETAMYTPKTIGERDGKGRESKVMGRYPALGTTLADFIRQYQNTPCVVIFRLAATGKLYMIGVSQLDIASTTLSLGIPAYFEEAEGSSGDKRESQTGTTIGWRYAGSHDAIEYDSTVPLVAA